LSGDYGPNFFGYAWDTATYVVNHPQFGWLAFGGNVTVERGKITVTPRDSARTRIYLAPYGLWLTLDSGKFDALEVNSKTGAMRLGFGAKTVFTAAARLRIEQPAKIKGVGKYAPTSSSKLERNAYVVPLSDKVSWIELTVKP
jgi:hypothetical protein